jgi:hypothetical protein
LSFSKSLVDCGNLTATSRTVIDELIIVFLSRRIQSWRPGVPIRTFLLSKGYALQKMGEYWLLKYMGCDFLRAVAEKFAVGMFDLKKSILTQRHLNAWSSPPHRNSNR